MLDEGDEIRKVMIANFKHQLKIFDELLKRVQTISELSASAKEMVEEYDHI
jgi:hypothetical protein